MKKINKFLLLICIIVLQSCTIQRMLEPGSYEKVIVKEVVKYPFSFKRTARAIKTSDSTIIILKKVNKNVRINDLILVQKNVDFFNISQ